MSDERGDNALYWAMLSNNWKPVASYLLKKGVNPNNKDNNGESVVDRFTLAASKADADWIVKDKAEWLSNNASSANN
jgi:ankyrin repeat protein